MDGSLLETPPEPPESTFRNRLRHVAYATREVADVIWAYMGPEDRMRQAEAAMAAREVELKEADEASRRAGENRAVAEEEWGTATALAALRVKAEGLVAVTARIGVETGHRSAQLCAREGQLGLHEGSRDAVLAARHPDRVSAGGARGGSLGG